jgi:hypothetical protein
LSARGFEDAVASSSSIGPSSRAEPRERMEDPNASLKKAGQAIVAFKKMLEQLER